MLSLLNFAVVEGLENTGTNFQPVPPDQVTGILTMIADKMHNNYDSIKTWQGKIDATVTIIYEGPEAERVFKDNTNAVGETPNRVKKRRESTVEFAADCENGSFYANKFSRSPLRYTDPDSGRSLGIIPNLVHNRTIATTEYIISSHVSVKRGDSIIARTAIKEKRTSQEECSTCGDDVFDPRSLMSTGMPLWETYPLILQYIQKNGDYSIDGHSLRIEKRVDGTTTEYRVEIPGAVSPGQYLFQTMVFSSENDFNVTLIEERRTDGKLFLKKTWSYEVIGSTYLPKRTTTQNFKGENAELSYDRECVYTNLQLNQAIPEGTFSYKNLGLKNGDKFVDKIADMAYIYQDENLIPADN